MGVNLLALARYTLKGPFQAATVVGLLAVLAVFVPLMVPNSLFGIMVATLFTMLSCTLVGLIILTQGLVSGMKAIGVSVLGITLVAWIVVQTPELGLWTALVQWMPIIILAQTLRSSKSLALTMLVGVLIGAIGIAAQYLIWTDLEINWISLALERMSQAEQQQQALVERNIQLIRLFVLALIAMAYLIFVLIVLSARWLQARIAESDGFGKEFRALSLGKPAATMALALVLLSFWLRQPWINSLAFLIVIGFMFQGIAVVHDKLLARKRTRFILGLFYALLLIFPQVVALTSITGLIDNWLVFRKKPAGPNDINLN